MSEDGRRKPKSGSEPDLKNPPGTYGGTDSHHPYAGRWVARLRGQIIGQGGSPEQARRAALTSRPKEVPEIIFMPTAAPLSFSPLLEVIRNVLPPNLTVHLVGGAVRDALMGKTTHDLDFAVPKDGIRTARQVASALGADFFVLDDKRDTGRVIVTNSDGTRDVLDFASYRGTDLEADLHSRDFTVNAMAVDVRALSLLDPHGGALDLKNKRLRACSKSTFQDDPVRILRAVRQAAAFGFQILPETRQTMRKAAKSLSKVSPERQRDELFRILEGPQLAACLRALDMLGVLSIFLPELPPLKGVEQPTPHVNDVWTHTLSVLQHLESTLGVLAPEYNPDNAADLYNGLLVMRLGRYRQNFAEHLAVPLNADRSPRALLFLAALYHDVAKPSTRQKDEGGRLRFWGHDERGAEIAVQRAHAFHLSNDEIDHLRQIVRHHMRIHFHANRLVSEGKYPTRRAIYRFFRYTGTAGVDVILLALADYRATYEHTLTQENWVACLDICRILLENYWEKPEEAVSPSPLVNGHDLMQGLKMEPGPCIGQLLEAIREKQAMGEIRTSQEAISFARTWLAEQNVEVNEVN